MSTTLHTRPPRPRPALRPPGRRVPALAPGPPPRVREVGRPRQPAAGRVAGGSRDEPPTLEHMEPLPRRDALVILAVLGTGVFLAGLELMITAVALPAIVTDLATWTRLREASWIINGYLLVYVVTMPLAGRLADLWGNRRLFLAALVLFTVGSMLAGAAPTLELLIVARLVQAAGGGALIPVATSAASHLFPGAGRPRALGVVGALTFLGMAAGPFLGAAILDAVHPEVALARLGVAPGSRAGRRAGPGLALGLLRQRPGGDRRPAHRVGGEQRLGDAPAPRPRGHRGGHPVLGVPRGIARGADAARQPGRTGDRRRAGPGGDRAGPRGPGRGRGTRLAGPRPARPGPVHRSAAVPERGVRVGRPDLGLDRLRAGDRDRGGGGVRGPRPVRRPGRATARAGGPGGGDWPWRR